MTYKLNIETKTLKNKSFRKILYTTKTQQLVIMSLNPYEEIGTEIHPSVTQLIKVEYGSGTAIVNKKRFILRKGNLIIIEPGEKHNIIAGKNGMKLYTIYSPPEHDHI